MPATRCSHRKARLSHSDRVDVHRSAAPIGRVAVGRDEQGHVIMAAVGRDAELDRHLVEEGRIGQVDALRRGNSPRPRSGARSGRARARPARARGSGRRHWSCRARSRRPVRSAPPPCPRPGGRASCRGHGWRAWSCGGLQTQADDLADLVERRGDLGVAVVGEAALHRGEDARLVGQAHADDEGEAEFLPVGGVERVEAVELRLGQPVEPGAGLLGRARLGEACRRPRPCRRARDGRGSGRAAPRAWPHGPPPSDRRGSRDAARASTQGECSNKAVMTRPARSAAAG